jgi:hypothetical protein
LKQFWIELIQLNVMKAEVPVTHDAATVNYAPHWILLR